MYDKKKKFRRSAATTVCYVLAALMLIYTCYQIGSTVHMINDYYSQYSMKATPQEYVTYILQNALTPLVNTIILFMLARILDEVRKNNPANFMSDEDIVEAGIAKKEAKDAKKFEKGEKAAAKAGHKTSEDEPVVADFTSAAEKEEPKKEAEKKPAAKKSAAKSTAKKSTAKKTTAKKSAPKKTEEKTEEKAEKKAEEKTEE